LDIAANLATLTIFVMDDIGCTPTGMVILDTVQTFPFEGAITDDTVKRASGQRGHATATVRASFVVVHKLATHIHAIRIKATFSSVAFDSARWTIDATHGRSRTILPVVVDWNQPLCGTFAFG
jgi:hypothetical protein